jgi:predicted nuclease of predicted toxin-antitoxin system
MPKFLVDENLPYYFSLWNNEDFVHVFDLEQIRTDQEIWDYAKKNNLTIITKDADFSLKILYNNPPPKVIHIRIGNMKIVDFFGFLNRNWPAILEESAMNKLVNIYQDRIESIQ